jgi:hypothetical protein
LIVRRPVLAIAAGVLAAASGLAVCCGKPSDEARIRELLERSVSLAEKRDVRTLAGLFAPDYRDFEGRDIEGTVGLVTGYLNRYHGVVIHLLGARVELIDPDGGASVECELSLSHGAAEVFRKLIRYAGEYYRFSIGLSKTERGVWRFTYAEWRSIGFTDLLPESLAVLKELFPDL